jgi:hypothetical protein
MMRRFGRGPGVSPRAAVHVAIAAFLMAAGLWSPWAVVRGAPAPAAPALVSERAVPTAEGWLGCTHGSLRSGGSPGRPCHDGHGPCGMAYPTAVGPRAPRGPALARRSEIRPRMITPWALARPPLRTSLGRAPPFAA